MATTTSQKLIRCIIVTPEQTVLDAKAAGVSLPLDDGSRGIAAGHAPFIGRLGAGEVQLHGVAGGTGTETTICTYVEDGFVEVGNNEVTVITQGAIDSGSIEASEAQAELENLYHQKAVGDDEIDALLKAESATRARLRAARTEKKIELIWPFNDQIFFLPGSLPIAQIRFGSPSPVRAFLPASAVLASLEQPLCAAR